MNPISNTLLTPIISMRPFVCYLNATKLLYLPITPVLTPIPKTKQGSHTNNPPSNPPTSSSPNTPHLDKPKPKPPATPPPAYLPSYPVSSIHT